MLLMGEFSMSYMKIYYILYPTFKISKSSFAGREMQMIYFRFDIF